MNRVIRPVFTLELNCKVVPGLVTIGKYDGTHPCLTAVTTADKILIHSPHRKHNPVSGRVIWSESNREIATLNINQTISAIVAAPILPEDEKDVLIIGTETHVLVYHVHDNKDILYKECPDGVKTVTTGLWREKHIIMIGGNSAIHGFSHSGIEIFWTAVGDVVTSLILMDYNKDNSNELIASCEDFNIRIFKGDQMIGEHVETEVVSGLSALPEHRFAYSVSNGTIGVYEQDVRLWRVKSKHFAISMQCYDLLGLGIPQLITGWSNGKVDCRSIKTGEVLFKDSLNSGAAGVVEGDYRSVGKNDIICVSTEGEVRGYTTTKSLSTASESEVEQDTIRELLVRKQGLLMELKHYESNSKYNENIVNETESYESNGVIPANTRLQIGISTSDLKQKNAKMEIFVSTNNNTIIKSVIIFAEGIFKGETHVIHPPLTKLKSDMLIPLVLPKDSPVDIHIKALIGYPNSVQFHVFEVTRQLPRFCMYSLLEESQIYSAENYVEFKINERLQRICMWVNQNFLLASDLELDKTPNLKIHFKCLRDGTDLVLLFEVSGKVVFYTKNIFLAADLVQSLAAFLKLDALQSKAMFGNEEEKLKNLLDKLEEIEETRLKLGSDVAERLAQIRTLVIQAEDSRLNDIKQMPVYYNELNILNKELITGYNIRLKNYNEGLETMKNINSIIQKASRLRVGKNAANMINHCRIAIKNNNVDGLTRIIRTGEM